MFSAGSEWLEDLWAVIEENKTSNFFFDEFPFLDFGLGTEELKTLTEKIAKIRYLWIAFRSDKIPDREDLEESE